MTKLEPLITESAFFSKLKNNTFYEKDIEELASFTFVSLHSRYSGLSSSELSEVYLLEARNMYNLLCAIRVGLGLDERGLQTVISSYGSQYYDLIDFADSESHSSNEREKNRCLLISKFIIADGDMKLKPKFQGKIPTKAFSFRQSDADTWFEEIAKFYITVTSEILAKSGRDMAQQYIIFAIAWYANMSQSFKYYPKSSDKHLGDSLINMLIEFINAVNGNTAYIKSVNFAPLYKDL